MDTLYNRDDEILVVRYHYKSNVCHQRTGDRIFGGFLVPGGLPPGSPRVDPRGAQSAILVHKDVATDPDCG